MTPIPYPAPLGACSLPLFPRVAVSYSVPCSLNDDRRHHGSNFFKSRLRPATLQRSTSAADPAIIISSSSAVDVERSDEEMAVAVAI